MIRGGIGGNRTLSGLRFEKEVDLKTSLASVGYDVRVAQDRPGHEVFFQNQLVARCFQKNEFYGFLEEKGVDWKNRLSKRLVPDNVLLVPKRQTLFVIEVKYQEVAGSVDEKLQTCGFKRTQYIRLVKGLGLWVEYVYVFNDWFKKPEYEDVLEYIHLTGCYYFFHEIPLSWLGLPEQG